MNRKRFLTGGLTVLIAATAWAGGRSTDDLDKKKEAEWKQISIEPAKFDLLQGQVHRANLFRNGVYDSKGLPGLEKIAWKFKTGGPVRSSPVVVGGTVYVGSFDGNVYAIDAASGIEKWKVQTNGRVNGSAAIVDGTVFIATEKGFLLALDAVNGNEKWRLDTGNETAGSAAVMYGAVIIGSGAKGGVEELNMTTGPMLAANSRTGELIWQGSSGPQGYAAITTDGKMLYAGANGSSFYSFEASSGKSAQKLRSDHQGRQWSSLSIRDSMLYVPVNMRGGVAAFEIKGEKAVLKWFNTTLPRNKEMEMNSGGVFGYEILSDLAVADKVVLAGCNDNKLYAFDRATGNVVWTFPTAGKIQSSPSLAGQIAYFGSWDGNLYAVDVTTGQQVWKQQLGGRIFSSPWPGDGVIYVGCDDGFVYALR